MIRPHGHKRSAAIGNANIEFCYRKNGLTRYQVDTQAFKDCMMTRGYRWVSTTAVPDTPGAKPADDSFIDPDTGMSCRDVGGGALCVPPQGIVHYQNPHGLNCPPESRRFAPTDRGFRVGCDKLEKRDCECSARSPDGFSSILGRTWLSRRRRAARMKSLAHWRFAWLIHCPRSW
jgi:hypothetical protein